MSGPGLDTEWHLIPVCWVCEAVGLSVARGVLGLVRLVLKAEPPEYFVNHVSHNAALSWSSDGLSWVGEKGTGRLETTPYLVLLGGNLQKKKKEKAQTGTRGLFWYKVCCNSCTASL